MCLSNARYSGEFSTNLLNATFATVFFFSSTGLLYLERKYENYLKFTSNSKMIVLPEKATYLSPLVSALEGSMSSGPLPTGKI